MSDCPGSGENEIQPFLSVTDRIGRDLVAYHPNAVLLFGSLARYLAGDKADGIPNDIDLIYVGNNVPFEVLSGKYGLPFEIQLFKTHELVNIAKTLRYDFRSVALSKLYVGTVMKGHAKNIIVASILLGPGYNRFGIEQIEIEARPDPRDYSIHKILHGQAWWSGHPLCP